MKNDKVINVYAAGDLHGKAKSVEDFWLRCKLSEKMSASENVLICLGDFGGNYYLDGRDKKFKQKLCDLPFTYFVIRGNHEERPSTCMIAHPENWHTEFYFNNIVYVENDFPQIKYAIDAPAIYEILGYKTLVLPGAYSIDKFYRLQNGWSWFEKEQMTDEEKEFAVNLCNQANWDVDLVLSHTCPSLFTPTDLFLTFIDQSTVDKSTEQFLGELEFKLKYHLWLFGHFHADRVYPNVDGRQVVMLYNKNLNLEDWMKNPKTANLI